MEFKSKAVSIKIFNVKFSANVGDGLIAECLEAQIKNLIAGVDVSSVDLAGRTEYPVNPRKKAVSFAILHALPRRLRRIFVSFALEILLRGRLRQHYRTGLLNADAVVLGGGNLFADYDLNFPKKINLAIKEATRAKLPIYIYACGVSDNWSEKGRALFVEALTRAEIRGIFLRDWASKERWDLALGHLLKIKSEVVPDPGLLASAIFSAQRKDKERRSCRIGIGVMSASELAYHGYSKWQTESLSKWYSDLAKSLVNKGYIVTLFCNGSSDDRELLARVKDEVVPFCPVNAIAVDSVMNPEDLAATISSLDFLIAFRLHAVICAYSYGIPFFALNWDKKLEAFLNSVKLNDRLLNSDEIDFQSLVEKVDSHFRNKFTPPPKEEIIALAGKSIEILCKRMNFI